MNNIFKLLKYDFGRYNSGINKIVGIIIGILAILLAGSMFINVPLVSEILGMANMVFVVSVLGINFIVSIVTFSLQISKEQGKLVFMFPVKSWEYMIAKYLEFIIFQLAVVSIFSLIAVVAGSSIREVLVTAVIATGVGTSIAYIIITAFIVIVASYIHNTVLCIIAVIFGGGILQTAIELIILGITRFLPYVYLKIGVFLEFDLIEILLQTICVVMLVIISTKHLDKKLDII